jgi:dihydroorotase
MHISEDGHTITMRTPDNWHAHFRDGALLMLLVKIFIRYGWRGRIVAEPNTKPPKLTGIEAVDYAEEINKVAQGISNRQSFQALPVIQITESTTPDMVQDAFFRGVRIAKVYPYFVTNNSENGVKDYLKIYPALAMAEKLGMVVQFHGEDPNHDVEGLFKEAAFLRILDHIVRTFPKLRLTFEHISTEAAVEWVRAQGENIAASITVQHLLFTIDDLIGYSRRSDGLMRVHWGFKPQAKFSSDRLALWKVILSGHRRFFYGGDDAAHLKKNKECAKSCCGAWHTMESLAVLIAEFLKFNAIEKLEPFLSEYGAQYYGHPLNEDTVTFIREDWVVPKEILVPELDDSLVPMLAGDTVLWKLVA